MTRKDAGEYTIRVENNIGEDMAHVLVTVIGMMSSAVQNILCIVYDKLMTKIIINPDRPSPPGKPTVIQLSDNSCVLEWEAHANEDVTTYIVEYFRVSSLNTPLTAFGASLVKHKLLISGWMGSLVEGGVHPK